MSYKHDRNRHLWRPEALSELRDASTEVLQVLQARIDGMSTGWSDKHAGREPGNLLGARDVYYEGVVVAFTLAAHTALNAVIVRRLMELLRTELAVLIEIS